MPIGEAWTDGAVAERKQLIETTPAGRSPLRWSVVESIPVPDDVKRLGGAARASIEAWIASMEAVARCGIKVICYNFMPVVDWCRTDLEWEVPSGAKAMRFDLPRFAAFELHIRGTHTAPLVSPQGEIPATGRSIDFRSCDMVRLEDGRLATYHVYFDQMGFMHQLGLVPG